MITSLDRGWKALLRVIDRRDGTNTHRKQYLVPRTESEGHTKSWLYCIMCVWGPRSVEFSVDQKNSFPIIASAERGHCFLRASRASNELITGCPAGLSSRPRTDTKAQTCHSRFPLKRAACSAWPPRSSQTEPKLHHSRHSAFIHSAFTLDSLVKAWKLRLEAARTLEIQWRRGHLWLLKGLNS